MCVCISCSVVSHLPLSLSFSCVCVCVPQVRGVAAGGIVSSAYCLLYKLFTLRLTRRQVQAMLDHVDSAYIRGLGFMYVR